MPPKTKGMPTTKKTQGNLSLTSREEAYFSTTYGMGGSMWPVTSRHNNPKMRTFRNTIRANTKRRPFVIPRPRPDPDWLTLSFMYILSPRSHKSTLLTKLLQVVAH